VADDPDQQADGIEGLVDNDASPARTSILGGGGRPSSARALRVTEAGEQDGPEQEEIQPVHHEGQR
jgi:hypothetical protein